MSRPVSVPKQERRGTLSKRATSGLAGTPAAGSATRKVPIHRGLATGSSKDRDELPRIARTDSSSSTSSSHSLSRSHSGGPNGSSAAARAVSPQSVPVPGPTHVRRNSSPRISPLPLGLANAVAAKLPASDSPLSPSPLGPGTQRGGGGSGASSPRVLPNLDGKSVRRLSTATFGSEQLIPWGTMSTAPPSMDGVDTFEEVDGKIVSSATFRELYRIVRMCSAQPSCYAMVRTLETQVAHLLNADLIQLWLVKRDHFRREGSSQPLADGITGYVQRTREIINLQNPNKNTRWKESIDGVDSPSGGAASPVPSALLCLPVEADSRPDCTGGKDVVGVFQAFKFKEGERFTNRDCKVLYRLGEFAGNLLRNSSKLDQAQALYNASLAGHQRISALLEIARMLSSETSLDGLLQIIVKKVPELLDADRCTLFLVDKEKQQLIVKRNASSGRPKNFVSWVVGQYVSPELPFEDGKDHIRLPIDRGIAGFVATTGQIINIEDAHLDPRFDASMDTKTGYRTRSILSVPMIDSDKNVIGVLQVLNKNPLYPCFDTEDEVLARTFSAQAAIAVRNSQLLAKTQQALSQSSALLEVTNALASELKIGALIKIIVAKVQKLLDSERCTVFIVDKETKQLYTSDAMSFGMGPALPIEKSKTTMIHFPMDRGIAGSVATTGKTLNIPDAYQDDRFNKAMDIKTGYRTRSILCMAIKNHHKEVIGVLQVMNKRNNGAFDQEDENVLSAFAAQAAVAIENSKLFQQTEKALNHALADQRNLKFLLSVTKNLFSDMHLTSMIDQMTMQVHHLLKADDCALYLVDDKTRTFYLAREASDSTAKHYPFGKGIAGRVAQTGEVVRISTAAHRDPRFDPDVDQRKDKTTHSVLCCPIKAELPEGQMQIIGVISVRDEKDRGGFEQEEEKLLKVFSAQAAVAILNSRRFTNIMEQSELKDRDYSAAEDLKRRGMNIASDDIESFSFKMEDIQLKDSIGTGSYGEVYRAFVKGRSEVVAVKKLHVRNLKAEQVDAFCKEASLMCQFRHPNVVTFIGAVTEPSNLCIITQYCHRGSLADLLLDDRIPMDFGRKLKFARDAARGMLYLHSSNPVILHRDLKSDNLLVTQDWTVKVADFGLTRFLSNQKAMTQVGTPMWMAPEIIMGRKYTEKADVYAFGIILWEIMTRLEPYEDKEPMQIVVEVVNEELRPTIPPEYKDNPLVPLMKDCWATDGTQRPSFKVILERLDAIAATVPGALTEEERRYYMERHAAKEREAARSKLSSPTSLSSPSHGTGGMED